MAFINVNEVNITPNPVNVSSSFIIEVKVEDNYFSLDEINKGLDESVFNDE